MVAEGTAQIPSFPQLILVANLCGKRFALLCLSPGGGVFAG
jgi:hypothetical protein